MANTRSWLLAAAAALLILAVVIGTGQTDELETANVRKRSAADLEEVLREILKEDEASNEARELDTDEDDVITNQLLRKFGGSRADLDESSDVADNQATNSVEKKFFGFRLCRRFTRRYRFCRYLG